MLGYIECWLGGGENMGFLFFMLMLSSKAMQGSWEEIQYSSHLLLSVSNKNYINGMKEEDLECLDLGLGVSSNLY